MRDSDLVSNSALAGMSSDQITDLVRSRTRLTKNERYLLREFSIKLLNRIDKYREDEETGGDTVDMVKRELEDLLEKGLGEPPSPSPPEHARAPVQGDNKRGGRPEGTITWEEHLEVYNGYAKRFGRDQSAERIAARGGFGYGECVLFTGHELKTWEPR